MKICLHAAFSFRLPLYIEIFLRQRVQHKCLTTLAVFYLFGISYGVFGILYDVFVVLDIGILYINFPALRHSSSMIHADESISQ